MPVNMMSILDLDEYEAYEIITTITFGHIMRGLPQRSYTNHQIRMELCKVVRQIRYLINKYQGELPALEYAMQAREGHVHLLVDANEIQEIYMRNEIQISCLTELNKELRTQRVRMSGDERRMRALPEIIDSEVEPESEVDDDDLEWIQIRDNGMAADGDDIDGDAEDAMDEEEDDEEDRT